MRRMVIAFVAILMAAGSPAVFGAIDGVQPGDDIQINTWPRGQTQGPFWARIWDDDPSADVGTTTSSADLERSFLTFCLERREYFYSGERFNIAGLEGTTLDTGRNLTGYAAWVYEQFRALGLTPATTTAQLAAKPIPGGLSSWGHALDLFQNAIWAGVVGSDWIVGGGNAELPLTFSLNDDYDDLGISYTYDFLPSTWAGGPSTLLQERLEELGNYRVIQIDPLPNEHGQDQMLMLEPEDQGYTPEPASLLIWGCIGGVAAGLNWYRRRKVA